MAKKAAKKKKKDEGEQQELFELLGEGSAEIQEAGTEYNKHLKIRLAALKKEVKYKEIIRELVKKAGLQRMPDGVIRFTAGEKEFKITPQDDKVQVRDKKAPKKVGS